MEKQYDSKRIPRIYFIIMRQRVLIFLNIILMMALSHFFLFAGAQGVSSELHRSVHVTEPNGNTPVCILYDGENLGCKATTSPPRVPFLFKIQSQGDQQKFTSIQHIRLRCGSCSHDESSIGG